MKNKKSNIDEINAQYGKLPPQAVEVEEAVLGALMLERDAIKTVLGIIDTPCFYKEEHQKIFDAIKKLSVNEKPIDLLVVTQALKDNNSLESIGGPAYITQLTRQVASAAHIEFHSRIIAEKYFLRETIRKANELINMAYGEEDIEVLSNEWKHSWEDLDNVFTVADTGSHIKQVLIKTLPEIEKDCHKAGENQTPGIPTGFTSLSTNTGGWRNGNLIVLAARPGMGKTSFALYFALVAAKAGFWVNVFSFEMNKEDLARILLSVESNVYRSNIRDGYLNDEDWQQINSAVTRLEKLPIIFRDSSGMNVNQVQATIRRNRKNNRCDFAIVDYLQLVKSSQSKAIRELEVSEISRTLKTTALNENIPILALSQLNRAADGETPKLSNLRESGAIEQDADIVMFLHRPDPEQSIIKLTVAKHRRGRLAQGEIFCNKEMTRFSEIPHPDNRITSKVNNEAF